MSERMVNVGSCMRMCEQEWQIFRYNYINYVSNAVTRNSVSGKLILLYNNLKKERTKKKES